MGGCALPSTVFSGAFFPDTAHTPPQADPRLSPLWRLGGAHVLCASVDVEGAHSHGPGGRALSLEVAPLEEGVCTHELLMICEFSKA